MKKIIAFLLLIFCIGTAYADFTGDIQNMCGVSWNKFYAQFQPHTHTCASGYYLPANTDGCRVCLFGHTCNGGTFTFNEKTDQGIVINQYNCNAGYFLPANTEVCRACPNGYTCDGGTFTFNEHEYQGVKHPETITTNEIGFCSSNIGHKMVAVFQPKTVTMTWNDGNGGATATTTCTYDGLVNLPPTPTRPGYTFKGWKLENNNN